jgi:predicted ATP-dependent endonuclease of OLD family
LRQLAEDFEAKEVNRTMSTAHAKLFRQYQSTEMLFARGVIFVEGPTDRIVYERAALALDITLHQDGICIMETGGDAAFNPYVEWCHAFDIPWVLLCDKKAYVQQEHREGPILKKLREKDWLSSEMIQKAMSGWGSVRLLLKNYDLLNKHLRRYHGSLAPLRYDDITDGVWDIIQKADRKNKVINDQWFKDVALSLGGSENCEKPQEWRNYIKDVIKKRIY